MTALTATTALTAQTTLITISSYKAILIAVAVVRWKNF